MEKFLDPYLWIFVVIGSVWVFRAKHALTTHAMTPTLKPTVLDPHKKYKSKITVIVPAKNEEDNIERCVKALLAQDYPNIQILIANDQSTDRTEKILQSLGVRELRKSTSDEKIAYFTVPNKTPEGWTGKNHALHSAIPYAKGDWLLFSDADTVHEPESVRTSYEYATEHDIPFLSFTPRCITDSLVEDIVQPAAMAFTGLWFPLTKVNDPNQPDYFANGQYILVERKLYENLGGHEGVQGEFLEDFALMRKAKESGKQAKCLLGQEIYGTRMYDSIISLWRGWRRIYLHAFRRDAFTLFMKAVSVFAFSIYPFLLFLPLTELAVESPLQYGFTWGLAIPVLLFILGTLWKAHAIFKAKAKYAIFHPAASIVIVGILLNATWMALTKKKTVWR